MVSPDSYKKEHTWIFRNNTPRMGKIKLSINNIFKQNIFPISHKIVELNEGETYSKSKFL